jgi:hypothetical protein
MLLTCSCFDYEQLRCSPLSKLLVAIAGKSILKLDLSDLVEVKVEIVNAC